MNIKQTVTRIFQLAIALLVGALVTTTYIQHRELAAQYSDLVPEHTWHGPHPTGTPKAFNPFAFFQQPPPGR